MIPWIFACAEGDIPESAGGGAEQYAGPEGRVITWAPMGLPEGDTVTLSVEHGVWAFEWADGTTGTSLWSVDDTGLLVDGVHLLPDRLAVGSTGDGVEVVASGEFEVWYGKFPDCITVEVAAGAWAGTQVFAKDIGLIAATWQGSWEAVYYE